MPNLKEVRSRITSVSSTQQITKAMKLVSATKLRKAQTAIVQMRPYAEKLQSMLVNLSDSIDSESLAVYFEQRTVSKVLIVMHSSDRGLCGAFNSAVAKQVTALLKGKYADQVAKKQVTLMPIGKKSVEFAAKTKLPVITDHKEAFLRLTADNSFTIAGHLLDAFRSKEYDVIEIVYNKFKNAGTQILTAEQYLPIRVSEFTQTSNTTSKVKNDYIFEPTKAEILEELVPRILKTNFYRTLLDSFASEHGARMVAMEKATENAGELLKTLRLQYNRARQAAITNEISEIVGGAAALSNG